jgi:hypothetical protein
MHNMSDTKKKKGFDYSSCQIISPSSLRSARDKNQQKVLEMIRTVAFDSIRCFYSNPQKKKIV